MLKPDDLKLNHAASVFARSEATKQSSLALRLWIASRSLSSGAHSRDPLTRNDDKALAQPNLIAL
jgi:hypothetical protein